MKQAILHLNNGEKVELSVQVSQDLLRTIQNNSQPMHYIMIHEGDYSYCMWNVNKIEWKEV